jgi:predicted dienelactone hydrolase
MKVIFRKQTRWVGNFFVILYPDFHIPDTTLRNFTRGLQLMRGLISAAILTICASLTAQPYIIGHTSAKIIDTHRGNRKITVEIYYPVRSENAGSYNDDGCAGKFPVICFAHGYQHPGNGYVNLTGFLVPEGYIILSLTTAEGFLPSHRSYAADLRFLADAAAGMGNDTLSPLYGLVDTLCCLMGHSLGGGAMFHAAADNSTIDAVIGLTPYDSRPSAIAAAAKVTAPTLVISGTNDCITPAEKHHLPLYEGSAAPDKTYIQIKGGSHCSMGVSSKCIKAERLIGCEPGLTTAEQTAVLARYIVPWLDFFLKGSKDQGRVFNSTLSTDEAVTWLHSRPLQVPED